MKLRSVISNAILRRGIIPLLGALSLAIIGTSCETVYDDQSDCPRGVSLRFVYEYHMERGANAFPSNVDCITVYVFDKAGNYVTQQSETSAALQSEDYRMLLPLGEGSYDLVVWGGMTCDTRRFNITPDFLTSTGKRSDIIVTLPLEEGNLVSKKQLHDLENRTGGLFWGIHSVTLLDDEFKEETVYVMKDTNNIQIILEELDSPYTANVEDYDFKIIDDNFVLDVDNNVIEIANDEYQPYYTPYAWENRIMGYVEYVARDGARLEEGELPVQVACAEMSTSRLFYEHLPSARLVVTNLTTNQEIINIPLIKYLLGIRGFGDNWIKSDQEFLDRQSRWTLMFFLQSGVWADVRIAVNWWTVRFNDVTLGQ